jgi:hypothetical protein
MGMTRSEWWSVAEKSAAEHYGRKYASFFMFRRWMAGPLGVVLAAGAFGWGAWWVWTHAAAAFTRPGAGLPSGVWVLAGAWLVVTVVAYRPGRGFAMPGFRIVKGFVVVAGWLTLAGYVIASL